MRPEDANSEGDGLTPEQLAFVEEESRKKWEPILAAQELEHAIDLRLTERLMFLGLDTDLRYIVRAKVKIESAEHGAIDDAIEAALRDKPLEWGATRKMLNGLRNWRW